MAKPANPLSRTDDIRVRIRPHEMQAVREAAQIERVTISELVRSALLPYVQRVLRVKP